MAAIVITLIESSIQIIYGIPQTVTIETSIPSLIFYTLDGSQPDTSSSLYVGSLRMPYDTSVTLRVLATNGVDSGEITEKYSSSIVGTNTRKAQVGTEDLGGTASNNLFPFGSSNGNANPVYIFRNETDITVSDGYTTDYPNAYDADGYETMFTNKEYNIENYLIVKQKRNKIGEVINNTGLLGTGISLEAFYESPESSNMSDLFFDPKAMVVIQEYDPDDEGAPFHVNRLYYELKSATTKEERTQLKSSLSMAPLTGTFLRQIYNPRTRKMNYYFRDNKNNRWIICSQTYEPTAESLNFSLKYLLKGGNGMVIKWANYRYGSHL